MQKQEPELIVMEATGGYERQVSTTLMTKGFSVSIVNPKRIRNFANATGQLAKNDKLDAFMIARFGTTLKPRPQAEIDAERLLLKDLVSRRDQLIRMRTSEKNRLGRFLHKSIRRSIEGIINELNKQVDRIDKEISKHIDSQPELKQKAELLKTIPGVGIQTAAVIVAKMPELGNLNRREAAMLVGVAPVSKDSGKFKGKRNIKGGRKSVRDKLYMPMLVIVQCNPALKKFYDRLISKGKLHKVARTATMRKLVCIMNTMLKNETPWEDKLLRGEAGFGAEPPSLKIIKIYLIFNTVARCII